MKQLSDSEKMANIVRFSCDDETGEVTTYEVNDETGEPYIQNHSLDHNNYNQENVYSGPVLETTPFPNHGLMCKTKKFLSLKAKILSGSNTISHRMLLLPTLMICPAVLCVLLAILEVYLHICCHKKNKQLRDPNLYYRSPFHMISSMFCGVCRDIDSASKIGQLQDERRDRYDYFRSIAI